MNNEGLSVGQIAQRCIDRYGLISRDERVVVALSGGKDSLTLLSVLKQCGYICVPAIVDMGYEHGWAKRVADAATSHGLDPIVLDVRGERVRELMSHDQAGVLARRLGDLQSIDFAASDFATPCTLCYNCKLASLVAFAGSIGSTKIAFGHHFTDAAVSLLKSALMYIDRWDNGNEVFVKSRFSDLVDQMALGVLGNNLPAKTVLAERVGELILQDLAGTDEPPRQRIANTNAVIVRPLFDATEDLLIDFSIRAGFITEPSGCGHGATRETETPREMIHKRIFWSMPTPHRNAFLQVLYAQIQSTLMLNGEARIGVRSLRSTLMGPNYKPGVRDEQKM